MQDSPSFAQYMILALCLVLGAISTALASPLYALYVSAWQISTSEIGYAFIAYMLGVVFTLLFLNGWIGRYGYKRTVVRGLIASILGLVFSAFSADIWQLCAARFLIGISSGLLCTATVIGLAHKYPFSKPHQAGKLSSLITVVGFGLGPILGGVLADQFAAPLITPYLVIASLSLLVLIACYFVQAPLPNHNSGKISLWSTPVLQDDRRLFWVCAVISACCFAAFSLYAALAGTFLKELPLKSSATLTGSAISLILLVSFLAQLSSKFWREITCLKLGGIGLSLGCLCLFLAQATHQFSFLALSVILIGLGHGYNLNPAYFFIGKLVKKQHSGVLSSFLLIAYQGTIWPILLSSLIIDYFNVLTSVAVFAILIFILVAWVFIQLPKLHLDEQKPIL